MNLTISIDGYRGSSYEARGLSDQSSEVASIAKRLFPKANIIKHEMNLGVGALHNNLQMRVFEAFDEWAVFLEEDIVLAPSFLREILELIDVINEIEIVARVSCFQPLPNVRHLPRGFNGFYPGHGTKVFAERRSFFNSKQNIVSEYLNLATQFKSSPNQFKHSQNSAKLSLKGHFLPYFQHDTLVESILNSVGKLQVVTRPNLADDIGIFGLNNYVSLPLNTQFSPTTEYISSDERRLIFLNQLEFIKEESDAYAVSVMENVFDAFHLSNSRKAMLKKIFSSTLKRMHWKDRF